MTAPGPMRPTPGSSANAAHPAGALWALLVIGLLVMLPCSGTARAAGPSSTPILPGSGHAAAAQAPAPGAEASHVQTSRVVQTSHVQASHTAPPASSAPRPLSWCSADDPRPRPGDGCSNHRVDGQDAQLPNAPPQPVPAAQPQLVTAGAAPAAELPNAGPGPVAAPDLHLLQVNRT